MVLELRKNHKKIGLWGIPYCIKKTILGEELFSRIARDLIPENSLDYSANIYMDSMHSALLTSCYKCVAIENCIGLGNKPGNLFAKKNV